MSLKSIFIKLFKIRQASVKKCKETMNSKIHWNFPGLQHSNISRGDIKDCIGVPTGVANF